jgi:hypothetical protein
MSNEALGVGSVDPFAQDAFGGEVLTGPTMPDIPGLGSSSFGGQINDQMNVVGCVSIERESQHTIIKVKNEAIVPTKVEKVENNTKMKKKPGRKPKVEKKIEPVTMATPSGVVKKKLLILRPTYKLVDDVVSHTTLALFDRTTMGYDKQSGDAMIYHSRNLLADRFMKSGYEWALWWDDDIIPPIGNANWSYSHVPSLPKSYPEAFLRINPIVRLISHGKTIIGGLYYNRRPPHVAICERGDIEVLKKAPIDTIIAREWVGTGFLLTHRSVFEDIQKNYPELAPKKGLVNVWESVWNYFQPSEMQAEDVSFCKRAKESGHQPYVDCGVVCFHLGTASYGPWNQK